MSAILSAGWGIVEGRKTLAVMLTRKAAVRRLKRERAAGRDARIVELWWSSGLQEEA